MKITVNKDNLECEICGNKNIYTKTKNNKTGKILCHKCYEREMQFKGKTRTRYTDNDYKIDNINPNIIYINLYDINGNYVDKTKIDAEDFFKCSEYKWHKDKLGYARTSFIENGKRKYIRLHKFITNTSNEIIDHINGDKLDNTKTNLRICTSAENIQKAYRPRNKSGVRGVIQTRHKTWNCYIEVNTKKYSKTYKTKEIAILQRLIWELEYYKEYAPQMELIKSEYSYLLGINKTKNMIFNTNLELIKDIGDKLRLNPHCPCLLKQTENTICPCLPCRERKICHCGLFINKEIEEGDNNEN